jgi:hypothetical protein
MLGWGRRARASSAILSVCVWGSILWAIPTFEEAQAASPRLKLGIEQLYRLDLLPRLKQSVKVGSVSSYDRSGGNDDGFSGKYSFLRKEPGGLVIADLEGPGVIYRMHFPIPSDDFMEFYFDGESTPRIALKVRELFDGAHPPFVLPLVGNGAGGHYSYVPIPYQRSCKILVKAKVFHFYQINYAQYPPGFVIPSYKDSSSAFEAQVLEKVTRLFASTGSDITPYLVPDGTQLERTAVRQTLRPGEAATLFERHKPGRIVGVKLGPASVFEGKDRDVVLRMYWDGDPQPAVASPVGDFFGYSFGQAAVRSILFGTADDMNYAYFPMPFEKSAKIELVSEASSGPAIDVRGEVTLAPLPKAADEGRFYALWRRENPTREGVPYTYLRTAGKGHVVGVVLQAQGMKTGSTEFFEGDDRAVIDGQLAIPGTGSEDSFNGGWYDVPGRWEARASFPLSGCLDYKKYLGRTGGYRLMIADAYAYSASIDYTIEHAPSGNLLPTDYTSVVFFYSQDRPTTEFTLPSVAARRVVDPERIVFVPGWNTPIHSFSFRNATLEKRETKIEGNKIRYLKFRATGEDLFGNHHISFICDMPSAGKYKIDIEAIPGPEDAMVQLVRNEMPVGEPANLHAEHQKAGAQFSLGVMDLQAGENPIFLQLVSKDPKAAGLGLDLVQIIFERVK